MPGLLSYDQGDVADGKILLKENGSVDPGMFDLDQKAGILTVKFTGGSETTVAAAKLASTTLADPIRLYNIPNPLTGTDIFPTTDIGALKAAFKKLALSETLVALNIRASHGVTVTYDGLSVGRFLLRGDNIFYKAQSNRPNVNISNPGQFWLVGYEPSSHSFRRFRANSAGVLSEFRLGAQAEMQLDLVVDGGFVLQEDGTWELRPDIVAKQRSKFIRYTSAFDPYFKFDMFCGSTEPVEGVFWAGPTGSLKLQTVRMWAEKVGDVNIHYRVDRIPGLDEPGAFYEITFTDEPNVTLRKISST